MPKRFVSKPQRLKLNSDQSVIEVARQTGISKHVLYRLTEGVTRSILLSDLAIIAEWAGVEIPFIEEIKS